MAISDIHADTILHKEFFDEEKKKNKGEDLGDMDEYLGIDKEYKAAKGGMLSMLPFFGCYGARDEGLEEEEEEEEEEKGGEEGEEEENRKNNDNNSGNNNCAIY